MNNISIDSNKLRSYGSNIIKQADDFKRLSTILLNKSNKNEPIIFNEFYNKLCNFGKMYELCADKIEESMLNNKYE